MKPLIAVFVLAASMAAQNIEAPSSQPRFLTKTNVALFSFTAAAMSLDGYSTQRTFNRHADAIEYNPLARPFVKRGALGQATISSLSFAAVVGTSYWAHKQHHHRLERWIPIIIGTASLGFGLSNLRN